MILDFKEIPEANKGGGLQDTFELFTRDFLSHLGYRIIEDPDRGADGKCDLIVEERVAGLSIEYVIRWLVSCKHYAHSGKSVNDSDEINIVERMHQHGCDGFMGVYSSICSTSLNGILKGLKTNGHKVIVYEHEKIEKELLKSDIEGFRICSRYMPKSFEKYQLEHPGIAKIFDRNLPPINCDCCGKDLLVGDNDQSIYVLLTKYINMEDTKEDRTSEDMYFACKGECDEKLKRKYANEGLFDNGWEDLRDLTIPSIWIMRLMAFLNGIQRDRDMKEPAFGKMKQMFIRTYPYVARNLTTYEKERVKSLMQCGLL